jgi:thioredoxin 1
VPVAPVAAGPSSEYSGLVSPGTITVVDFYATWCGPCKQMAPILDRLVSQQSGVVLRKVDIGDWGSSVAKKYNITSVPNVRVFDKHGKMIGAPTSDPNQVARYIEQAKQSK